MVKPGALLLMIVGLSSALFAALPTVASAADDDDPWFVEATSAPSGPVSSVSSPLSTELDCSDPGNVRAIFCDPYAAPVGAPVTLTLRGFGRSEFVRLRFYRELDNCAYGRRCWTEEYELPMTTDGAGRTSFTWDTSSEQPGAFRFCVNSLGSCQSRYVADQLTPADTVTVGAYGPDTCQQGYVWREAFASDHACVTPDVRMQAARDNSLASARKTYGPDTCVQGYVWREARLGDHVCVTPDVRAQATDDNAQAAVRRQPGGGAYGPDTCRDGFVWRDALSNDHVCVTPDVRRQAALDNSRAIERVDSSAGALTYGIDTCRPGFVWRDASAHDHVCVTPDVRTQAAYDNSQAKLRVLP